MFPRKTVLLLLLAIILVSLAVRYPLVEHERYETDSYFIHTLSSSIVRDGQAAWTFNPLSYVGYFPFSYPSGVPFVLAEMSILTGLEMNVCILFADFILSTLFCLVVFCLSREFIHRAEFALLASLFAVLAPRFVDTTYWDGSARGMEVVLITLLVFAVFRAAFLRSNLMLVVSALIGVACLTVHHMAILLILYGAGYVLAALTIRYLPMVFRSRGRKWATIAALSIGLGATLLSLNYFGVLGNSVEKVGENGFFEIKSPLLAILVNLVTSYIHQIGLVLVLAAFGVIAFLRVPRFDVRAVFPLVVLIAFVPVMGSSLYVSMLLAPFVAVLGATWVQRLRESKKMKTKTLAASLAILIALSLTTTVWSVDRWNQSVQPTKDIVEVNDGVFNDAMYLSSNGREVFAIGNSESLQGQLTAYSDTRFLGSGIQAAINKDVTGREIRDNLKPSTTQFPGNLYHWYTYDNETRISLFALALMTNGVRAIAENFSQPYHDYAASHSNLLIVVDNTWHDQYASIYGPFPVNFLKEVRNSAATAPIFEDPVSYCTYGSERVTIYMVHLPLM
jgi:hypothetical protein